jgi:hypothetical protein
MSSFAIVLTAAKYDLYPHRLSHFNADSCAQLTSSMFASNFTVKDSSLVHLQGQDKLTAWSQADTISTGNTMTNYFCKVCGTLMYRVTSGLPEHSILRIGTIDDFSLHETKLKPWREQFVKDRVSWFTGGVGVKQQWGNPFKDGEEGPWVDVDRSTLPGF